jgi:hypothetical protein
VTVRRRILFLPATLLALLAWPAPAGAQQLIDAGEGEGAGGVAFVAFTIMCILVAGALFFMDRIRRRGERDESDRS